MRVVERLDRYQRAHGWLGAPIAVVYKFFDDRGPYLAALVTYYGFVSLFPLMLLFTSALGFFLDGNPRLQHQLLGSVLRNFPIIGAELENDVTGFHGSGLGLAIGVLGTLYGGTGVMQAAQAGFNRIYAVPRNEQPNPLRSRLRSFGLLFLLGGGAVLSTGVAALAGTGAVGGFRLHLVLRIVGLVLALCLNVALFTAAFQLLTACTLRTRQVIAGGVVTGLCWEVLQTTGARFASQRLQHANAAYGSFGLILGALAWIYLQALVLMISAESNVVAGRRLYPRALLTPFTDDVELTAADRRAYTLYTRTQRFKGFQRVHTTFDRQQPGAPPTGPAAPPAAMDRQVRSVAAPGRV